MSSRGRRWRSQDGGQPREQQEDGGVVRKGGVHGRIRQDDVKALVAIAPTDGNPIEITTDDTGDVAVTLSYMEGVGEVFVTAVAAQERLETLMGQPVDISTELSEDKVDQAAFEVMMSRGEEWAETEETLKRKKGIFSAHRGIYSSPKSNWLPCQNLRILHSDRLLTKRQNA